MTLRHIRHILGSLPMAAALLVTIAGILAWGTVYETRFGTAAVQRFVYRAWWFQVLLGFLALNLAAAALQRYPWRRKHIPFLLAHLGIILILVGGILGGRFGIEGQLIIPEGSSERLLQLPSNVLVVREPNPGVSSVVPTNFETTAWIHEPDRHITVPLEDRQIELIVDRYYPDAVKGERVTGDGAGENPAVLLAVSGGEQKETVWLFSRDVERFGIRWNDTHLFFLEPRTEQAFAALLGMSASEGSSRGVVTFTFPDLNIRREIPVPEDFSQLVTVSGTPYTVTFKEYFTDLAVTAHGIVNRSSEPNNPAVALVLSGPEGVDARLVFARHPDFPELHGQRQVIPVQVTYTHARHSLLPPHAIALIRHPSGELSCALTEETGLPHAAACTTGQRYAPPGFELQFEILEVLSHARITAAFQPHSDEVRAEALHLTITDDHDTSEAWLGLRERVELPLGGHPLVVEYRPDERELPFTVKLLDFRRIDYPGTQMAAGYESDVELSDPQRGIVLRRTISMNNPLRYRGFSLYQSSYLEGPVETTVLSVRSDPGTPLVYGGFLLVIVGVVGMFLLRGKASQPDEAKTR